MKEEVFIRHNKTKVYQTVFPSTGKGTSLISKCLEIYKKYVNWAHSLLLCYLQMNLKDILDFL